MGDFQHVGMLELTGVYPPKMDGENNGKPWKSLLKWDDLGVPLFLEIPK